MKIRFLKYAALSALLTVVAAGCGKDDDVTPEVNPMNPEGPIVVPNEEPSKDEVIAPEQQKEQLENIAQDFSGKIDVEELSQTSEKLESAQEAIGDYDTEDVEEWAQTIIEGLSTKDLGVTEETEESYWGGITHYTYHNYETLVAATNYNGHFEVKNGKWVKSADKASDFQLTFPDASGNNFVLTIASSGKTTKMLVFKDRDWEKTGSHKYEGTIINYIAEIPQKITVKLTSGNNVLLETVTEVEISKLDENKEFQMDMSSFVGSTSIKFAGMEMNIAKMGYTAVEKAYIGADLKVGGQSLLSGTFSTDLEGSGLRIDLEDLYVDEVGTVNAKNIAMQLDVLGAMQIKGTLTDINKITELLNKAADNDDSEEDFQKYIDKANEQMVCNVYYDGNSAKQASLVFEPFADENGYYYAEPCIKFYDGSSVSTLSAFAESKEIKSIVDTFVKLLNDFAEALDK